MNDSTLLAVDRLLQALCDDDVLHGGLLSRSTIHAADQVRLLVGAERRRRPDAPAEQRPKPPRSRRPL
jgi:hypothetical protein